MSLDAHFWDPNESSSDDDDYNTPSSPSSNTLPRTVTPPSPPAAAYASPAFHPTSHRHQKSVTTIRLAVQMSDDEDEETRAQRIADKKKAKHERKQSKQIEKANRQQQQQLSASTSTSLSKPSEEHKEHTSTITSSTIPQSPARTPPNQSPKANPPSSSPPPIPRRTSVPVPFFTLNAQQMTQLNRTAASASVSTPSSSSSTTATPSVTAFAAPTTTPLPLAVKSFASHLSHNVDPVMKQVTAGAYTLKRVASLFKKLAVVEEEYAKNINKVLASEQMKMTKVAASAHGNTTRDTSNSGVSGISSTGGKNNDGEMSGDADAMSLCIHTYQTAQELIHSISNTHLHSAQRMMMDIVVPLLEYYSVAEERRKEVLNEEKRLTQEMNKCTEEVQKNYQSSLKLINQAKSFGGSVLLMMLMMVLHQ